MLILNIMFSNPWNPSFALILSYKIHVFLSTGIYLVFIFGNTVKQEMLADINVCEFAILKVFALLKFAILVLPKVNFVFPIRTVFYYCFF